MVAPQDQLGRGLSDLRISVTDRCNFRCGYCMPADVYDGSHDFLPRHDLLSFEEIQRIATLFVQRLHARKLRITGGEPLVRRELPHLVEMLAAVPGVEDLALTTNGQLLTRHARALADAGLQRVTVSLDALDEPTFLRLSGGRGDLGAVLAGLDAARAAGLTPLKINCVVQKGINEHAIEALVRYGRSHGHIVRFIEFMDVGTLNAWRDDAVVTADEILQRIDRVAPLASSDAMTATPQVAERYRYADGCGEVGVIASITRPFCGDCTRARLSADGKLVTCLFAARGHSLRDLLRGGCSDDELEQFVRRIWRERRDRYSQDRASHPPQATRRGRRLQMYQLGG